MMDVFLKSGNQTLLFTPPALASGGQVTIGNLQFSDQVVKDTNRKTGNDTLFIAGSAYAYVLSDGVPIQSVNIHARGGMFQNQLFLDLDTVVRDERTGKMVEMYKGVTPYHNIPINPNDIRDVVIGFKVGENEYPVIIPKKSIGNVLNL